ncbi:MAG: hypothetical protein AAGD23_01135 [Pseudomonadota bacterium]
MKSETEPTPTIHASAVAIGGEGVLIRGLPRAGKTTLGQALIAQAGSDRAGREAPTEKLAMWVSDDRTIVEHDGVNLIASPPAAIAGRIADRKRGIVSVPHAASAILALVVDLDLLNDHPQSLGSAKLLGEVLPMLRLPPVSPINADDAARHVLSVLQAPTDRPDPQMLTNQDVD